MSDDIKNTGEQEQITPKNSAVDDFDYLIGENGFSIQNPDETDKQNSSENYSKIKRTKNKEKHNGAKKSIKTIIWIIVIFVISILLALGILLVASEYLGVGINKGGKCVVEIEKGMPTSEIAAELKEQGAISSEFLFRVYSKLAGFDGTYQYGVYNFTNELGTVSYTH